MQAIALRCHDRSHCSAKLQHKTRSNKWRAQDGQCYIVVTTLSQSLGPGLGNTLGYILGVSGLSYTLC